MTPLLFCFLCFSLILLLFNRYRASKIFLSLTVLIFLTMAMESPLAFILQRLEIYPAQSAPTWKDNNAIVLLGAGTVKTPWEPVEPSLFAYSRILEAARLYNACKKTQAKCKIVVSGGDALKTGRSEAAVYGDKLHAVGVLDQDIILEDKSLNTYKNAEFTSKILKTQSFTHILLVTSGVHMRRSLLYFSNFGIDAIPAVADYLSPKITMIAFGYHFAIMDIAVHELAGVLRLHVYNYLGWNKDSSKVGAV